jgi:predicted nucleic acid-binding Zn ribbon protein
MCAECGEILRHGQHNQYNHHLQWVLEQTLVQVLLLTKFQAINRWQVNIQLLK